MRFHQLYFAASLAGLLVYIVGCGDQREPQRQKTRPKSKQSVSVTPMQQAQIRIPEDLSLPLERYLATGMPEIDRPWMREDFAKAATAMAFVATDDIRYLPRYKSDRSGEVFQRFTTNENLDHLRDTSLSMRRRIYNAGEFLGAVQKLQKLYLQAFLKQAVGDSEMVELTGLQLRIAAILAPAIGEDMAGVDRTDPANARKLSGHLKVQNGVAMMILGASAMLSESHVYRKSEQLRLISYLEETLPVLLPELRPEERRNRANYLYSLAREPRMGHLKTELTQLNKTINEVLSKINTQD